MHCQGKSSSLTLHAFVTPVVYGLRIWSLRMYQFRTLVVVASLRCRCLRFSITIAEITAASSADRHPWRAGPSKHLHDWLGDGLSLRSSSYCLPALKVHREDSCNCCRQASLVRWASRIPATFVNLVAPWIPLQRCSAVFAHSLTISEGSPPGVIS